MRIEETEAPRLTAQLQQLDKRKLRARYSQNDQEGAVKAAYRAAAKEGMPYYVYAGNRYGVGCYRVTYDLCEACSRVNNPPLRAWKIGPDGAASIVEFVK